MGKWTDKNYITHSEWERDFGGAKKKAGGEFRRLPFNCCAISLRPFETPVCSPDGSVFDLLNIIPYIRKFQSNPVTGQPLKESHLITLHFHKNQQGEFHDPVTFKNFNDHSHIVAIRTSGNVYEYNTVKTLNMDVKNLRDLMTDQPFERSDIITIQDPQNIASKHDFSRFHHVKNKIRVNAEAEAALAKDARFGISSTVASETLLNKLRDADVLASTGGSSSSSASSASPAPKNLTPSFLTKEKPADNQSNFSNNRMAGSLTSTATSIVTKDERAMYHLDDMMYERIKKKAYARIMTNMGNINVELFADMTPMTVHNFILLAKRGYYRNVPFHRSIANFMIQGGDPTGTGSGGQSAWGAPFKDEFPSHMSMDARGLLCMANRGPGTNGSQFFFTLRPCKHLDRKHTIFGKIVGGADVLTKMEGIATDSKDRPKEPLLIVDVVIFVDPFEEYETEKRNAANAEEREKAEKELAAKNSLLVKPKARTGTDTSTVGRYIAASKQNNPL